MSFPSKAPSSHPPGLKLGVFAGGGPFPRLVAPGIVVGDPGQFSPGAGMGVGAHAGAGASANANAASSSSYWQMGLTHVLTRARGGIGAQLPFPQDAGSSVELLMIEEEQTLREVVELLVGVRVACPHGRILIVGEPFVAVAYMMAIEGRDLQGTWRLVTGEALSRRVYREVHGVLGKFAKDVEEEGKRLAREEERQHLVFVEEHPLQPQRKRGKEESPYCI